MNRCSRSRGALVAPATRAFGARRREQAAVFPEALRANLLRRFVPLLREHAEELSAAAERGLGARVCVFHLDRAVDALLGVLWALNGVYDPADKRAERTLLPRLGRAPGDLLPTLTTVLEGPFDPGGAMRGRGSPRVVVRGRTNRPGGGAEEQPVPEAEVVATTPSPRTRESLAADLRELGVTPGMIVLVHSSLRSLGWVCGGPVAVVQALTDAATASGTIATPTHSGDYSGPAGWENPPVPREWWPVIRDTMPAYDPRVTPARAMGAIVETFRTWPGTLRSAHPAVSFAARGRHAAAIVAEHALDDGLGEGSPLARLYDLGASVLLLGVGYDRNTSFHLAEYRLPHRREIEAGAPVAEAGRRVWKRYRDIDLDASPFPAIGAAFDRTGAVRLGRVGNATARLVPLRAAVDFALTWLERAAR